MSSAWWMTGCAYGATSVLLGAFGAHGLKTRVSDPAKLASWSTAAHYQVCFFLCVFVNFFGVWKHPHHFMVLE
jgi:uncharacterized membrane protein YgdD (TMEM256/DUF423 family)